MVQIDWLILIFYFVIVSLYGYWIYKRKKQKETSSADFFLAEGTLSSSWNLELPDGFVQPGLRMLVDVDPGLMIPLATRDNLIWPASGTPQALSVQTGPTYNLTFIPVTQSLTGATGDVTVGNFDDFLPAMRRLHPIATPSSGG